MELAELAQKARISMMEARSVDYLVNSREFEETWGFASLQERNILSLSSKKKVRMWMDAVRRSHIDILRTRELKQLARALHIKNYSRQTRTELQESIWEYYEHRKSSS